MIVRTGFKIIITCRDSIKDPVWVGIACIFQGSIHIIIFRFFCLGFKHTYEANVKCFERVVWIEVLRKCNNDSQIFDMINKIKYPS